MLKLDVFTMEVYAMEETREIDIDLRKIFYMMRTKVIYILVVTVFAGAVAGCYTHFFIDPTYSASIKLFAYSNTDRVSTDASISNQEFAASRDIVNTDIYILQSDSVIEMVIEDLGLNTSVGAVKSMISASQIPDTIAFQVTVNSKDPNLSAKIANSIAKIAPTEVARIVNAGGISVIDYAKVPTSPSSPNTKKNIMMGLLAGFAVSFAIFFIYELFDSTITEAKDLEREFEIPILGTIPRLEAVERTDNAGSVSVESNEDNIFKDMGKPSSGLLESIQSVKGDIDNDKK